MRKLFMVILVFLLAMSLGACKSRQADEEKESQENSTGDNIAADVWEKPSDSVSGTKDENATSSDKSEQKEKDSTPTDAPATDKPSADSPTTDGILDTNPIYEGDEGWLPWK